MKPKMAKLDIKVTPILEAYAMTDRIITKAIASIIYISLGSGKDAFYCSRCCWYGKIVACHIRRDREVVNIC